MEVRSAVAEKFCAMKLMSRIIIALDENAIFRTRDEGTSILGERYNAGNNFRSKEKREAPYAVNGRHQNDNWTLSNWQIS